MIVHMDLLWLNALVSTVLPVVVGLVTKSSTPAAQKAILLGLLAAVTGVLTQALGNGGDIQVQAAIISVMVSWVTAVGTYYGLLGPMKATSRDGDRLATVGRQDRPQG